MSSKSFIPLMIFVYLLFLCILSSLLLIYIWPISGRRKIHSPRNMSFLAHFFLELHIIDMFIISHTLDLLSLISLLNSQYHRIIFSDCF